MTKHCTRKPLVLLFGLALILPYVAYAMENSTPLQKAVLYASSDQPSAKEKKDEKDKDQIVKEPAARLFAYKPPLRGTPGNRVGGGTRGTDREMPVIAAIVPDHTGLTTKGQPTLYWHLSNATKYKIEFTLNDEQSINPILEVDLKDSGTKGFHSIRLSDYNISLAHGIEYQWFVAIVRDSEQRSKDIIATGTIRRVEPSKTLTQRMTGANKRDMPYILADQGIWYDTFSSLSDLMAEDPNDGSLLKMRTDLIKQIGLLETIGD